MLSEEMGSQLQMEEAMMAADSGVAVGDATETGANSALWGPGVPVGPVNQGRWTGASALNCQRALFFFERSTIYHASLFFHAQLSFLSRSLPAHDPQKQNTAHSRRVCGVMERTGGEISARRVI